MNQAAARWGTVRTSLDHRPTSPILEQGQGTAATRTLPDLIFWKCNHRCSHCLVKYLAGYKILSLWRGLHVNPEAEISVSHALSTHSFPPAWNWKTHPRDIDTCTPASRPPCHSKPASSFPASSPLFCVFSSSTKEQTVSWARAAPNYVNLNTCQSYFHMKCSILHSCFHRLLWKAAVLSRTNIRSHQKNILK